MATPTQYSPDAASSPFSIPNIRLYVAFRIFFNGRFYYPIFTILFLDFGLTLDQFALLNAVWAATIVLLEVPSGALADIIGRKNLLVFAGLLMVVEIGLLCIVPLGNATLLFVVFLVNRVLSGMAEAAASGADEALAYDSLKMSGKIEDWGVVLERQMRYQSMAFIIASSIGAAVYDPQLMQRLAVWLGLPVVFTQQITLRIPLFLTLVMAIMALITTLRMTNIQSATASQDCQLLDQCQTSVWDAFRITLKAGRWILITPFALVIIAAGMLFDHVIRMLLTLNSQYFRLIDLPEATFGLIGSGMALLGLFIPRLSMRLANRRTPTFNLFLLAGLTLIGLYGMTWFLPIFGLLPMLLLYTVMLMTGFFISHYLNRITESEQRATVLSFKGLSYNLAYGLIGIMYSGLLALLRGRHTAGASVPSVDLENTVFVESVGWFPGYFAAAFVILLGFSVWRLRHTKDHKAVG